MPTDETIYNTALLPPSLSRSGSTPIFNHAHVEASGAAGLTKPVASLAFTQLAAADTIELVSANNADNSQFATVVGVTTSNLLASTRVKLNGTTAVEVEDLSYVEQVFLDAPCAGIITIRRKTGPATVTTIAAGELRTTALHLYCIGREGPQRPIVYEWGVSLDSVADDVHVQLRYYPSLASSRSAAASTGFIVLGDWTSLVAKNKLETQRRLVAFPSPEIGGGWLALMAEDGASTALFSAWLTAARGGSA